MKLVLVNYNIAVQFIESKLGKIKQPLGRFPRS
jgi:hypothetical protein